MKKLVILLVVVFAGSSSEAFAAWDFTHQGKVVNISVSTGSSITFQLEGEPALCSASSPFNSRTVQMKVTSTVTEEDLNRFLSLLLAAEISGKTVKIFGNNPTDGYWGCKVGVVRLVD